MRAAVWSVLVVVGLAGPASAEAVLVGRVTDVLGKPVADARVRVLASGAEEHVAVTDRDGNYRLVVAGDREIEVVIGVGGVTTSRTGTIRDGATQRIDVEVETADGEVVRIIDRPLPAVPPKRSRDAPRVPPPYSAAAIVRDAWAKAWLVLDIDERGKVRRVKLLKRPGFDLDEIAVREAMKLTFEPALDAQGKPVRAMIVWAMEWPAHGWLVERDRLSGLPATSYAATPLAHNPGAWMFDGAGGFNSVPCLGSGPLNLDSAYPAYRDCSRPNLDKAPYLPWLDGTQPIPPDPPQFAPKPEPPLHLTKASYIPQIAATTVSAGLVAGWVATYVQYRKYSERVLSSAAAGGPVMVDLAKFRRDRDAFLRWQKITIITAVAAIASGGFTTSLWFRHQRRADFSVQPEGDGGASVVVGGRF